MEKFKPTPAEWLTIKEVALRGHFTTDEPIKTIAGVQLELRTNVNVNDRSKPSHINKLVVTNDPIGLNDLDLDDLGTHWTDAFRKGAELTDDGDGVFDFYIYNRYYREHGELCGNVGVRIRDGKMVAIWISGGNDWSWTPETGIVRQGNLNL